MYLLMNYSLVGLLMVFILYIFWVYKVADRENLHTMGVGKILLAAMAIIGHGSIVMHHYQGGQVLTDSLKIMGVNLLVILILTVVSHAISFLEPLIWHIIAMMHLIGSIMLHRLNPELAWKHNVIICVGFAIMILLGYFVMKFKYLDRMSYIYIVVAVGMLLMVNSETNGAMNWFEWNGISFQPSEFVKIVFAFFLASIFCKAYSLANLAFGTAVSGVIVLILVWQRDLGSAFLFFALYMVLSYMYSRKRWMSFVQLFFLGTGAYIAYVLFGHVRTRVLAWLDPFSYIDREGYQITQAMFAFANGKWMGTGLFGGSPKKIPVVTTDFIFAAVGEEFGSVFALLIMVLYLLLIIILLSQSQKTKDLFKAYVSVGLIVMFGFQVFLILGGVIKLIPLTGVTLPFISYGGTSLIASTLSIGFIEAITKAKNRARERKYRKHTIITLKAIMFLLYACLIGHFLYFIMFQSESLQLNSYNSRLSDIEQNIVRGRFYDRDGKTLAYSTVEGDDVKRVYPYGSMFSHVIGYSQVGKTGMEAYMNVDLLDGHLSVLEQFRQNLIGDKALGSDVYLTLDLGLQQIAHESLEGKKGAVIVMEPSTGKILAMVSKPDHDPNLIEETYDELINDDNGVLLNRATNGVYPPGSTFKTLTAISYVHQHGEDFFYFCSGRDVFSNKYIHCYGDTSHGRLTIRDAFAQSCNTSFATMGEELDLGDLEELANRLMFNSELPYDYDHVSSSFILPQEISGELRAETVIGQGETLITPLHNLLITSAIANGGRMMKPYLVDGIVNPYGKLVEKNMPGESGELFSTYDVSLLKEYMRAVVTEGTGKDLQSEFYQAAGKTGAAENPLGDTHAWFVGFAPVENPEIAVAVIVENSGSSSANSVPVAKSIFDYHFDVDK